LTKKIIFRTSLPCIGALPHLSKNGVVTECYDQGQNNREEIFHRRQIDLTGSYSDDCFDISSEKWGD
jgi:hypothetical protein